MLGSLLHVIPDSGEQTQTRFSAFYAFFGSLKIGRLVHSPSQWQFYSSMTVKIEFCHEKACKLARHKRTADKHE